METTTIDQILADIIAAKKSNKWLSCTYRINTDKGIFSLGVKAYGLWVQRLECCNLCDTIPEQKTIKAFKLEFMNSINSIIRSL